MRITIGHPGLDPVGTEEKHGFDAATSDAYDMFQSILKIRMITVQVNGNEMAWVCENTFGTEPNVETAYSIETFAWDDSTGPAHQDVLPHARNRGRRCRSLRPPLERREVIDSACRKTGGVMTSGGLHPCRTSLGRRGSNP